MAWVAAIIGAAMSAKGQDSARKGAHSAREQPASLKEMQIVGHRLHIAQKMEELADKLLNDQPISGAERTLIDQSSALANKQINEATAKAQEQVLGAAAGTGFLKGGRTMDQIRKLSVDSATARQQVALQQQQAVMGRMEQNKTNALNLLTASLGLPNANFQNQPLASDTIKGAQMTQLGGASLELAGQLSKAQAIQSTQQRSTTSDPNSDFNILANNTK